MAASDEEVRAAWEAFRCSEGRGGAPAAVKRPRRFGVDAVTILPIAEALRLVGGLRRARGVEDGALFLGRRVVVALGDDEEGGADRCVVGPDMALMI